MTGLDGQQPARRPRQTNRAAGNRRQRFVTFVRNRASSGFSLLPTNNTLIFKILGVVVGIGLIYLLYQTLAAAAFFQLQRVDVTGAQKANVNDITRLVKQTIDSSGGVWKANLDDLATTIKKSSPWVQTAVVSRVLPAGVRVRITEREAYAVVRRSSDGQVWWVDRSGEFLGQLNASDPLRPPFYIYGWDESKTETATRTNNLRLDLYDQISRALIEEKLTTQVSEVNMKNIRDIRARLVKSSLDVILGDRDLPSRLVDAVKTFERDRGEIGSDKRWMDMTRSGQVVYGSGTRSGLADDDSSGTPSATLANNGTSAPEVRNGTTQATPSVPVSRGVLAGAGQQVGAEGEGGEGSGTAPILESTTPAAKSSPKKTATPKSSPVAKAKRGSIAAGAAGIGRN